MIRNTFLLRTTLWKSRTCLLKITLAISVHFKAVSSHLQVLSNWTYNVSMLQLWSFKSSYLSCWRPQNACRPGLVCDFYLIIIIHTIFSEIVLVHAIRGCSILSLCSEDSSKPNFALSHEPPNRSNDDSTLCFLSFFLSMLFVKICICKNTAVNNDIIHTDVLSKVTKSYENCI